MDNLNESLLVAMDHLYHLSVPATSFELVTFYKMRTGQSRKELTLMVNAALRHGICSGAICRIGRRYYIEAGMEAELKGRRLLTARRKKLPPINLDLSKRHPTSTSSTPLESTVDSLLQIQSPPFNIEAIEKLQLNRQRLPPRLPLGSSKLTYPKRRAKKTKKD